MRFFKRKKKDQLPQSGIACTSCRSKNTLIIINHGSDQPDYVRVWRGKRYLTCRCLDCGQEFYTDGEITGIDDQVSGDDRIIDDEEALREAENQLKQEADEENDHRFWQ